MEKIVYGSVVADKVKSDVRFLGEGDVQVMLSLSEEE